MCLGTENRSRLVQRNLTSYFVHLSPDQKPNRRHSYDLFNPSKLAIETPLVESRMTIIVKDDGLRGWFFL